MRQATPKPPAPDPTLVAQQQSALAQNVRTLSGQSGLDTMSLFRLFGGTGMSGGPAAGGAMMTLPSLGGAGSGR